MSLSFENLVGLIDDLRFMIFEVQSLMKKQI